MVAAIKKFGFKIPVLARHCEGEIEVVDGDLRIKAARKLRIAVVPTAPSHRT
jgi:ParB-like chromosome segregation protein Spo0J